MERCPWAEGSDIYTFYHDAEWGVPVHDDGKLFEMLILEGMQAGLSWITVLKKREEYRNAFDQFDVTAIASYGEEKINQLLNNKGIIRNKLKIQSAVKNAQAFLRVQNEYGTFDEYIWSFINYRPLINHWKNLSEVPAKTDLSDTISKDLKKKGFKFVGSIIVYSFMQATGLIMDHLVSCFRSEEIINSVNIAQAKQLP